MTVKEAFSLMLNAHAGQEDKAGEPYYFHLLAVENAVGGLGDDFRVVALLHDMFEDTDAELSDYMAGAGRAPESTFALTFAQANALDAITKRDDESYGDYLRRCREDFIASVVKWADLNHNMSPERQANLDPAMAKSLAAKYERGRRILLGKEQ